MTAPLPTSECPAGPEQFYTKYYDGGKVGFRDVANAPVILARFDDAGDLFSCGRACVRIDDRWGYIDITGRMVIETRFSIATPFCLGLACVQVDGHFGIIDSTGDWVVEPRFAWMSGIQNNGTVEVGVLNRLQYIYRQFIDDGLPVDNYSLDIRTGIATPIEGRK